MNAKQKALLDEVKAAGGQLWIESTLTQFRKKGPKSEGYGRVNAVHSLVSAEEKPYCPGGFRREVKLRIIEEQEIKRYPRNDVLIWCISIQRILVALL